ncbi:hypothetical protein VTI74DRAFT_5589 [Chaetomium olivicolor]
MVWQHANWLNWMAPWAVLADVIASTDPHGRLTPPELPPLRAWFTFTTSQDRQKPLDFPPLNYSKEILPHSPLLANFSVHSGTRATRRRLLIRP